MFTINNGLNETRVQIPSQTCEFVLVMSKVPHFTQILTPHTDTLKFCGIRLCSVGINIATLWTADRHNAVRRKAIIRVRLFAVMIFGKFSVIY